MKLKHVAETSQVFENATCRYSNKNVGQFWIFFYWNHNLSNLSQRLLVRSINFGLRVQAQNSFLNFTALGRWNEFECNQPGEAIERYEWHWRQIYRGFFDRVNSWLDRTTQLWSNVLEQAGVERVLLLKPFAHLSEVHSRILLACFHIRGALAGLQSKLNIANDLLSGSYDSRILHWSDVYFRDRHVDWHRSCNWATIPLLRTIHAN